MHDLVFKGCQQYVDNLAQMIVQMTGGRKTLVATRRLSVHVGVGRLICKCTRQLTQLQQQVDQLEGNTMDMYPSGRFLKRAMVSSRRMVKQQLHPAGLPTLHLLMLGSIRGIESFSITACLFTIDA
jgi:hypothetical protein